jgi:hypothetical protein
MFSWRTHVTRINLFRLAVEDLLSLLETIVFVQFKFNLILITSKSIKIKHRPTPAAFYIVLYLWNVKYRLKLSNIIYNYVVIGVFKNELHLYIN